MSKELNRPKAIFCELPSLPCSFSHVTNHVTNGGYVCVHDIKGNIDLRLSCYFADILSIINEARACLMPSPRFHA